MVKANWHYEDWFCKEHHEQTGHKSIYKCFGRSKEGCFQELFLAAYPKLRQRLGDLKEAKKEWAVAMSNIERNGVILMDRITKRFLLVKDAGHGTYMFPRGKVNKNESASDCIIRELKEEVNLDLNMCSKQFVKEVYSNFENMKVKFLCFVGDFEDYSLTINCKKEISEIRWMSYDEIYITPEKQKYMVNEFMFILKKMLRFNNFDSFVLSDTDAESQFREKRNAIVNDGENLETFGMTSKKDRMTVEDMIQANARIENRKILKYDGHPDSFGEIEDEIALIEINPRPIYKCQSTSTIKPFSFDYNQLVNCFCYFVF